MKNRIIIIEGPQGSGKTTLAEYLRDNIAGSNLYRLSGQKDKTKEGKEKSKKMYFTLIEYMEKMQEIPLDLIFDRTFFTEEIYSRIGYKEYSFTDVFQELVKRLENLNYDIYYFCLYLKDTTLYQKRLDRKEHHLYQAFSLENSINQQNAYLELADELSKTKINVIKLKTDHFEEVYQKVKSTLNISGKEE